MFTAPSVLFSYRPKWPLMLAKATLGTVTKLLVVWSNEQTYTNKHKTEILYSNAKGDGRNPGFGYKSLVCVPLDLATSSTAASSTVNITLNLDPNENTFKHFRERKIHHQTIRF